MRNTFIQSLTLTLALIFQSVYALGPIVVRGNKLFDFKTGERFFIKGITYDYDVSDDHYDEWSKATIEANLKNLVGHFNVLRLYNINPDKKYTSFMNHMKQLKVFVMVSASPANDAYFGAYRYSTITKDISPDGKVISKAGGVPGADQAKSCYPALLLNYGKKIITDFAQFDHTLAVLVANEIMQETLTASACVKQYVADLKNWMRVNAKKMRVLPLAYAAADSEYVGPPRVIPNDYAVMKIQGLLCGDKMVDGVMRQSIDIFLLNEYRFCNGATFEGAYRPLLNLVSGLPIVIALGEYGCVQPGTPRTWKMVPYIFGDSATTNGFSDVYSGGFAYTFGGASLGPNSGYPLFNGGSTEIVGKPGSIPTVDFTNLQAQFLATKEPTEPATWTDSTKCKWSPTVSTSIAPTNTLALKNGWIPADCANVKILTTDSWLTNTRQNAVCSSDGATCEVAVNSKLGTSEEDLCGEIEIISGGGSCKISADCGRYGQCVSSNNILSCQCTGCYSGSDCSIKDSAQCSQIASLKNFPKLIFTAVGGFLIAMLFVFGTLGVMAKKKSTETSNLEKLAQESSSQQMASI